MADHYAECCSWPSKIQQKFFSDSCSESLQQNSYIRPLMSSAWLEHELKSKSFSGNLKINKWKEEAEKLICEHCAAGNIKQMNKLFQKKIIRLE